MTREVVRLEETLKLANRELEHWQGQAAALTATVAEQQKLWWRRFWG